MDLTPERKATIDALDVAALLTKWRFTPAGNPWFAGETGDYITKRLAALRDADPAAFTAASKAVGWQR